MNERIQQLALQAGLYDEKSPKEVPGFTACFEKFAELVVRECVGIVEDAVNHREPASTYVDKIKEHFGVEL